MDDLDIIIEEEAIGCIRCQTCKSNCPENAISNVDKNGTLYTCYIAHRCLGTSCKRCVRSCPVKAITYRNIKTTGIPAGKLIEI